MRDNINLHDLRPSRPTSRSNTPSEIGILPVITAPTIKWKSAENVALSHFPMLPSAVVYRASSAASAIP